MILVYFLFLEHPFNTIHKIIIHANDLLIIRNIILTFAVSNLYQLMISTFGSKATEKIWKGEWVKNLPNEIQKTGRRKLRMINNSQNLIDLRIPPSNMLEKLSGKLSGFYSIRINDQWRIVFKWERGNAKEVTLTDYHS